MSAEGVAGEIVAQYSRPPCASSAKLENTQQG